MTRSIVPSLVVLNTHAITVVLWPSSPQHRSWTTCIAQLLSPTVAEVGCGQSHKFPSRARPNGAATVIRSWDAPPANLDLGLAAPARDRLVPLDHAPHFHPPPWLSQPRHLDRFFVPLLPKTHVGAKGSKVPELLGRLRWLGSLGVQTVFGWVVGVDDIRPIEVMGHEVIPAVAEV